LLCLPTNTPVTGRFVEAQQQDAFPETQLAPSRTRTLISLSPQLLYVNAGCHSPIAKLQYKNENKKTAAHAAVSCSSGSAHAHLNPYYKLKASVHGHPDPPLLASKLINVCCAVKVAKRLGAGAEVDHDLNSLFSQVRCCVSGIPVC
jgi:hypothetical protein